METSAEDERLGGLKQTILEAEGFWISIIALICSAGVAILTISLNIRSQQRITTINIQNQQRIAELNAEVQRKITATTASEKYELGFMKLLLAVKTEAEKDIILKAGDAFYDHSPEAYHSAEQAKAIEGTRKWWRNIRKHIDGIDVLQKQVEAGKRDTRSEYKIYLHYTKREARQKMEKLSHFLEDKGYVVTGIKRLDEKKNKSYSGTDIRYFHSEDKAGAEMLQQDLEEFQPISLKLNYLGKWYPNVPKGRMELWLDF
ncbi:MAG: hypothetical protein ACYS6K_05920 [Planctomycetota bacterium]|jgi:hypothetical protein